MSAFFSTCFKRYHSILLLLAMVATGASPLVQAEKTELKVLVRSNDAKFIGSGVGGLNVTVANAQTGELLASGQIAGATGDTEALMKSGQTRGQSPVSEDAANFRAQFDLKRPTQVLVTATGPLNFEDGAQTITTTLWMVPGKDMVDPGLVLHMPGLLTDLEELNRNGRELSLTAEVTMMCGCPITKDGLWDSDNFTTVAQLYRGGELVKEAPLTFTGTTNQFAGSIQAPEAGDYQLVIYSWQQNTGNTGVYDRMVTVN
ncbi:hypothetical protein F6455_03485 [Proteobacteria bacterium 005FR1]|nr:hypothetical protein [Proteobacteria bacterium 005FR1]